MDVDTDDAPSSYADDVGNKLADLGCAQPRTARRSRAPPPNAA